MLRHFVGDLVAHPVAVVLSNNRDLHVSSQADDLLNEIAAASQEQAANKEKAALAAQARAASDSEVKKYMALISAKIRHNIVMPLDVADDAKAEFVITLLPDGGLLGDPKLVKSSGNAAYDRAVEGAILKTKSLPLPQDEAARARFINPNHLRLKFSPKDEE